MVTWSPDTCKCTFKLNIPDYSLHHVIRTCPAHIGIDPDILLDTVKDENHLKNDTMTIIRDTVPELTITDEKGNILLKPGEVLFQFEGKAPNRTIRIITEKDISAHEIEIKDQIPDVIIDTK